MRNDHARTAAQAVKGTSFIVKEPPRYEGRVTELLPIVLLNLALSLLTMGLYRFWAKTRLRRYFLSHVSIIGDRMEYTGTGKELFVGAMIVGFVLTPFFAGFEFLLEYAETQGTTWLVSATTAYVVSLYFLLYVAIFRAQRYRLTRTLWRGIRGGQTGSALLYASQAVPLVVITIATAGLAYPFMRARLQGYKINSARFGDLGFQFKGRAITLFKYWLVLWLSIPGAIAGFLYFAESARMELWSHRMPKDYGHIEMVLIERGFEQGASALAAGLLVVLLAGVWYRAAELRFFAGHTKFGEIGFSSTFNALHLFLPYFVYAAIILPLIGLVGFAMFEIVGPMMESTDSEEVSAANLIIGGGVIVGVLLLAGILRPLVLQNMLLRRFCSTLTIEGKFSPNAVMQSTQKAPSHGEGLADALDVDAI
jgi:uncharacterized membrane protein YjgN (DUF898 family)